MPSWVVWLLVIGIVILGLVVFWAVKIGKDRRTKNYERGLKMMPMLIHLPPSTDDIQGGGRDERDVTTEALSQAQVMYSIIASTLTKGFESRIFGQRHISFEIVAKDGLIKYYTVVPAVISETVKQAILSAYPTARLEEVQQESLFSKEVTTEQIAGGEITLKKEFVYPISTYEETKRDASLGILSAMSVTKLGEGIGLQLLVRPTDGSWTTKSTSWTQDLREGKKKSGSSNKVIQGIGFMIKDIAQAFWHPPDPHEYDEHKNEVSNLKQDEIAAIENKTKYPGFETLIRVVASSKSKERSEAMLSGVVAAFSQFDSPNYNGFQYDMLKDMKRLSVDYVFRVFPAGQKSSILNSVELASIFHLPAQSAIPTSQVERQATKQVDGPAKLATEGVLLGVNEFRGEKKEIRLSENDRRRHTYVIGSTGMGKSVLLTNIAYQDMLAGRGFTFIDPHGDAAELLLSKVPEDRIDDVIYFDPADMEHPVGMNMFEWTTEDQKDFIVQEGINMLQSLFDPNNQGFFGPRGQHMFRNAALLLMSDPHGATFIDIPQCFTDPEFVKSKLKYVKDKAVYDYWTKEFPASQKSSEAGDTVTWFASKWGPFLSNITMRNILGQVKSGFNIREIMDSKKIFLVNLSKGRLGDINSNLLGMILVMKFQQAAMSRADIPEHERQDFCLFVDEFQNFATESFESILSEARKYRLNLVLANQFMTQLTDKIREGILGNVGTIMSGRLGVTDAELMEKAFSPVFNAEDLTKQGNYQAIAKVMMFDLPTAPFTMKLIPPMGEPNPVLLETMKTYSAAKYARSRSEVEAEIKARWAMGKADMVEKGDERSTNVGTDKIEGDGAMKADMLGKNGAGGSQEAILGEKPKKMSFLESWKQKRAEMARSEVKEENTGIGRNADMFENGQNGEKGHLEPQEGQGNSKVLMDTPERAEGVSGGSEGPQTTKENEGEMVFRVKRK